MKTTKLLMGICIFILLLNSVYAISQPFETSSVSRIVGNSIEDMKNQLQKTGDDLKFEKYIQAGQYDYGHYTGEEIPKKYIVLDQGGLI
ncbi:hypothetical protein KY334_01595 [Candidatus Woesearchaeota archaeon]|nr:hypothetical protein [Candidatus Woesearchaeota archaeon]